MKRCTKCREFKELSEFNIDRISKDGHQSRCIICGREVATKYNREVRGYLPMEENKTCSQYLGIVIGERLCRHLFKDVVRMPNGNPGFDFICAKDKKIDVKSACITLTHNKKNPIWKFSIRKNKIADYFLLIAFNSRADLEPLHQWLIPGDVLNHLYLATIPPSTINKWGKYKQDIGTAKICCSTIKKGLIE